MRASERISGELPNTYLEPVNNQLTGNVQRCFVTERVIGYDCGGGYTVINARMIVKRA